VQRTDHQALVADYSPLRSPRAQRLGLYGRLRRNPASEASYRLSDCRRGKAGENMAGSQSRVKDSEQQQTQATEAGSDSPFLGFLLFKNALSCACFSAACSAPLAAGARTWCYSVSPSSASTSACGGWLGTQAAARATGRSYAGTQKPLPIVARAVCPVAAPARRRLPHLQRGKPLSGLGGLCGESLPSNPAGEVASPRYEAVDRVGLLVRVSFAASARACCSSATAGNRNSAPRPGQCVRVISIHVH